MQLQLLQLYFSCTVKQTGEVDMDKNFFINLLIFILHVIKNAFIWSILYNCPPHTTRRNIYEAFE